MSEPTAVSDPRIGTVLQERYRILERLAAGGMGVVYRGERLEVGKPVAIKFLHAWAARDEDFRKRFQVEARAMSRLTHPCCVSVIDFGVDQDSPYMVMDFVTGETLRGLLREGPLPLTRALATVRQVLAGLAHAHGQGIIHRDIKPENIIVTHAVGLGEQVRILDFGLAKLRDEVTGITAGMMLGTPAYMAPEQIHGEPVGPPTDLYATGVMLFELLTAKKPFSASGTAELLRMHREQTPPLLREAAPEAGFSAELEAAIAKALAKAPAERFQSAAEFLAALELAPQAGFFTASAAHGATPTPSPVATPARPAVEAQVTENAPTPTRDMRGRTPVGVQTPGRAAAAPATAAPAPAPETSAPAAAALATSTAATGASAPAAGTSASATAALAPEALAPTTGASVPAAGLSTSATAAPTSAPEALAPTTGASAPASGPSASATAAPVPAPAAAAPMAAASAPASAVAAVSAASVAPASAGAPMPAASAPSVEAGAAEVRAFSRYDVTERLPAKRPQSSEPMARMAASPSPRLRTRLMVGGAAGLVLLGAGLVWWVAPSASTGPARTSPPAPSRESSRSNPPPATAWRPTPEPLPGIDEVHRLIAAQRRDAALAALKKLAAKHPTSAYVRYLEGNVDFDNLRWVDGVAAYRAALRNDAAYRNDPTLIQNAIRCLVSDRFHGVCQDFLRKDLGESAVPYLEEAARSDPMANVRTRAASLLRQR
jgi:hypothetical protein